MTHRRWAMVAAGTLLLAVAAFLTSAHAADPVPENLPPRVQLTTPLLPPATAIPQRVIRWPAASQTISSPILWMEPAPPATGLIPTEWTHRFVLIPTDIDAEHKLASPQALRFQPAPPSQAWRPIVVAPRGIPEFDFAKKP